MELVNMFIYSYIATDNNNNLIENTVIAKSKRHAFVNISEKNLFPLKIKYKAIFILNRENFCYRTHFFHQLAILSSSGINLLQCLKILQSNCHLPFWTDLIENSILHIEKGEKFSQYLSQYPTFFNNTILSIVMIAEKTGQYEESFNVINIMLEHNEKSKLLIKKAIRYPTILSLLSIILIMIMMIYVVPQFENIYESSQQELPFITKIVIFTSAFLNENIFTLLALVAVFLLLALKFKNKTQLVLKKTARNISLIKEAMQFYNLSLYFLTMYSTIKVGLSLSESLKCTIQTINDHQYQKDCKQIHNSVYKGQLLSYAMSQTKFFPNLAIQLISIAEESGKLYYFSQYLFKYYSEQYIFITEKKIKNLEPILLMLIAILVGLIMLAMYLPIFNLGNIITEL